MFCMNSDQIVWYANCFVLSLEQIVFYINHFWILTLTMFIIFYWKARFVKDIQYRKLGSVSWVQNVPHKYGPLSTYHDQNPSDDRYRLHMSDYRSI